MITQDTINFVEPFLKSSIKEHMPLHNKILLYDALVFCSLTSKTKMFCSDSDIAAFKTLSSFCTDAKIPLESYLSCAYNYIQKYTKPGHRLGFSYFLNDSVVEFCGENLDNSNGSSLLVEIIKDDLLTTEKLIRTTMSNQNLDYDSAFSFLLRKRRLSNYFLAYKKFCLSPLVAWYESEYFNNLVTVLEPFFTYILAKNYIYTPYKIQTWNNSKLEDYAFCPVYFKDRYITNELYEGSLGNESTDQGTAVHSIFETIIGRFKTNKTKDLSAIADRYFASPAFIKVQDALQDHIPFIQELFKNKTSILHTLCVETNEILIEHKMNALLANDTNYYGTADLIIISGDTAHILDYKTSKLDPKYMPKNNKKYTKQLSLYAKLLLATRPEIKNITATLIYTRGHIQPLEVNFHIDEERSREIQNIKKDLKSGVLLHNKSSCFLCRHPHCKFRERESIWAADGSRKNRN